VELPVPPSSTLAVLRAVLAELETVAFDFPAGASREAGRQCQELLTSLRDDLIPRAEAYGVPPVVGVAGPTGVGKSVMVNSLVAMALSPVGLLRPTTTHPLLVGSPGALVALGAHPAREAAQLCPAELLVGPVLLDCADPALRGIDPMAGQPDVPLDGWLCLTSALRYGDAAVWNLLALAAAQGKPVALVINRVPPGAAETVLASAEARLREHGWSSIPVFVIDELPGQTPDLLPYEAIAAVSVWLAADLPGGVPHATVQDLPDAEPWDHSLPQEPEPISAEDLGRTAAQLAAVAEAHAIQAAAVELLLDATAHATARAADRAAKSAAGGEADERVQEAWLAEIGPGGALTDVVDGSGAIPADAGLQTKWVEALARVDLAVAEVDGEAAANAMAKAQGALADVWCGADVPEGSRRLMEDRAVAEAALPDDLRGPALHRAWDVDLETRLEQVLDPAVSAVATALTPAGLATLIQAAVLKVAGPRVLLTKLLGGQATALLAAGAEALATARSDLVRRAVRPYLDAVESVQAPVSKHLPAAAELLANLSQGVTG
jgi:hypothetical protein